MAIDTTQSWQEYIADGTTAYFTFDFNYNVNRPQDIVVGLRTADNTFTTIGAENYQLIPNAAGDGGQVRFIQITNYDDPDTPPEISDNIIPAGTIVRIERQSLETSDATWQIGLEMSDLVNLFDRLFRLVQENKGNFDNAIHTFETQHNVSLYEMLSAHDGHMFYWDNENKTITPTEFPKEDVVRAVNGLFFRISTNSSGIPYLEWSANGTTDWHAIDISGIAADAEEALRLATEAKNTADAAKDIADSMDDRLTQAETDAADAKSIAENTDNTLVAHMSNFQNPHDVTKAQVGLSNVDNTADLDKPIIIKSDTIPTAAANVAGKMYLYNGVTNNTFTHGYIYECVSESSTEYMIDLNAIGSENNKLGFDYEHHNVLELYQRIAALSTPTFNPTDVKTGSFRFDKVNELWYVSGYDENNNALFTDFTIGGTGDEYSLDAYGFVYIDHFPDNYENNYTEEYEITTQQQVNYSWHRIDVQPNTAIWGLISGNIIDQADLVNYINDEITPVSTRVSTIESYIPTQTSTENKLADKNFVNSSIATNTANFIGTFNSVQDLENYSGTLTNNDYAFVVGTDSAGNTIYDRYKYTTATTPASWVYEYTLNNSSFTAAQWAAINSGATQTNIASIGTHIADKNNPHEVTKAQVGLGNVNNTSDLDKPISTATQNALDGKQNTISDLATIRSGAAAGATAVQPGDLATVATSGSYNDLTNKPTLGTAAAADVTDFATAAQGAKADTAVQPGDLATVATTGNYADLNGKPNLATVATSGSYNDLSNKPTIPAAQVNSDWNANSGVAQILNKPTLGTMAAENANDYTKTANLATVATSGSYNDLSNKPTIPAAQVNSDWNANSGVAQILNKPTLGTAAAADTTDFATAAQGAAADTAIQPGDNISELNNDAGFITMSSLTGFMTLTTAQTVTGLKTFNADIVLSGTTSIKNTTNGVSYTLLYRDTSGIHVGTQTQALLLAGSGARPKFNNNDLALLSDIPSVPTVNNPTITITQGGVTKGSFTLNQATSDTIALDAGGGGGSVDIDNSTITKNVSDEIQAVAVIDQNTGIAKTWTGLKAEYDAIVTKDPETEYLVTDDIGDSATVIGEITEDVNELNAHRVIAFQAPTADNDYTWYRKYADGWVEQGGRTSTNGTQTLPVTMADTNYTVIRTNGNGRSATTANEKYTSVGTRTTTTIHLDLDSNIAPVFWQVSGMAA